MILSGRDLQWYIETGKLKISPIVPEQFQQNGVDLILAECRSITLPLFYLGGTAEVIEMPDDLMAFVEIRSTWARSGFFLPPTIIDAGFCGNITLEILKVGTAEIPIGKPFAHIVFAKLSSPSLPYRGKYDGQRGITEAKFTEAIEAKVE